MKATPVREDTVWVEHTPAAYRVYFWEQHDNGTWACEPLRLEGVSNVQAALDWARADESQRRFVLYTEHPVEDHFELTKLFGDDPL